MNLDNIFKQERKRLKFYNSHPGYKSSMSRRSKKRLIRILNKAGVVLDNNSHVLDIGCGDGRVSKLIASQYECNVIGADYSEARVERGKQTIGDLPVTLVVDNAYDFIDKYEGQADLIMLFEVLEHLSDPKLLLEKCKKKSKTIVGSVPLNMRCFTHIQLFKSVEAVEALGVSVMFRTKRHMFFSWV